MMTNETGGTHITNTEVSSPNHLHSEQAIIISYSEFVFLALVIRHAKRMRRYFILTRNLFSCTAFFRFIP
jgi:hypothetical protein